MRTPTSYISGKSKRTFFGVNQPHSQRKVRAQKIEKSPKAAERVVAFAADAFDLRYGHGGRIITSATKEQRRAAIA
jgi:hypothetical protein